MNLIDKINEIRMFSKLTRDEVNDILKKIKYEIKEFEEKSTIVFRGEQVKGLFIILEGKVDAEMLKETGELMKIEEMSEKTLLAPAFIFGKNTNYPVDLVSKTSVKLLFIDKSNLIKLLSMNTNILEEFLNDISQKAQFLSLKVWSTFNNKSISEKLNEYIVKNESAGKFIVKTSIKSLAEKFEVTRPSLSRVISNYIKEGIIEKIDTKTYKILDRDFFKI